MEEPFLKFDSEADLIAWLRENINLTLDKIREGDYYSIWEKVEAKVSYKNKVLTSDEECVYIR